MKLEFKSEDFISVPDGIPMEIVRNLISSIANIKFEQYIHTHGKVVYGASLPESFNCVGMDWQESQYKRTHQAVLINIEEIKKCEHSKDKIMAIVKEGWDNKTKYYAKEVDGYQCQCGARVEPVSFRSVK